jgi:demethylmenaquinone methyltransferase/2-methoxy-6-polyprenyl-1,4-benzoquinol methylase
VAAEYRYLKPSIERYPTGPELVDIAIDAGFAKATFYELAPGGLMGCLVCEK